MRQNRDCLLNGRISCELTQDIGGEIRRTHCGHEPLLLAVLDRQA